MKILVTGGAGAIGSHVVERLIAEGHQVTTLDCFTDYYDRNIKEINAADVKAAGAAFYELDLATDDLSEVTKGVEVVYHFAAQPGISSTTSFDTYLKNNIIATQRLIEAVEGKPSLKAFVNIATSSVYGKHANDDETTEPKPTSIYGVTKLAAEQLVMARQRDKGFPGLSLRLFSVYGERERPEKLYHKLVKAILEDKEFPLFEGARDHVRSYSYVGDILNGIVAVQNNLEKCIGEIFNLGTDVTHTTGEGIDMIEEIMGKKAKFLMKPPRSGDQKETSANIDKIRNLLGYNPQTSLREGLAKEVEWYKTKIHGK